MGKTYWTIVPGEEGDYEVWELNEKESDLGVPKPNYISVVIGPFENFEAANKKGEEKTKELLYEGH